MSIESLIEEETTKQNKTKKQASGTSAVTVFSCVDDL